MHVLIPAGGRGVRLRPLTSHCPKPLLPLGDRPILTRIVEGLPREVPVTILITPHLEPDFRRWKRSLPAGRNIRLYVEQVGEDGPAGPVNALSACVREFGIEGDLLVLMGDSLLPFTLREFFGSEPNNLPRLASYQLADLQEARRFGVLEIGDDGCVASFEEKPPVPRSPWVFTGCLYLPQRLVSLLGTLATEGLVQMGHLVVKLLHEGERVEVFRVTSEWNDIGTLESYLQAHRALLPAARRRSLLLDGNRLDHSVYVHPSATVTTSHLTNCVVLAGAQVVNAKLTNCVVQPHVAVKDRSVHGKLITSEVDLPFLGEAEL